MSDVASFLEAWAYEAVRETAKPKNVLHSSESNRWFTPAHFVDAARDVLGRIDLDPASEPIANEAVGATRIITELEDGLVAPWRLDDQPPVTIWLNPPGGKRSSTTGQPGAKGAGNRSLAGLFWERLLRETAAGNVESAVFLAFNLELLQTTQNKEVPALGQYLCCIPRKRIAFERPGQKAASPTHGNVFAYIPGTVDRSIWFIHRFASIGTITKGVTV
jgi:hypothetical protein